MANIERNLDKASARLLEAYHLLGTAAAHIHNAFDGYDPGYPYPDSVDARAWDYVDVIQSARHDIRIRLETWDGFTND